jgi:hypothetical protein
LVFHCGSEGLTGGCSVYMDEKRLYGKAKRIRICNRMIMNGLTPRFASRTYRYKADRQLNLPELLAHAIQTYRARLMRL